MNDIIIIKKKNYKIPEAGVYLFPIEIKKSVHLYKSFSILDLNYL